MTSATRTYGGRTAADRRAARRSALIDAALDLFAEGGASAVSMRAVCGRARLNDRYFYESFADVDALLEAVMRDQTELGRTAVSAVAVGSLDLHEQIRLIARAALEFLTEDPRRGALLLGSRTSAALQRARLESTRAMSEMIATLGGGDPEPGLDREVATYALVSGAMEVVEAWLRDDIDTSREHLADLVAGLLAAIPGITAALPAPDVAPG